MNGLDTTPHCSLTLTTRVGLVTCPARSRGPITDRTAPAAPGVQNGRAPLTPSSSPIALLREQTWVSRLSRAVLAVISSAFLAGFFGRVSTMSSGPRLLAAVEVGAWPGAALDGRLWTYCLSGLPSLSVKA